MLNRFFVAYQGRREGALSVAFEVLIMNYETDFINLFIFSYLALNIDLFIFNCLTSNFCSPKNIYFGRRREQLFMDAEKKRSYKVRNFSVPD